MVLNLSIQHIPRLKGTVHGVTNFGFRAASHMLSFERGRSSVQGSHGRCSSTTKQHSIQPMEKVRSCTSNFQPNIWDYESLPLLKTDHSDELKYKIKMLVEEMRNELQNEAIDPLPMLELIDNIQRFGLGYHFEEDIKKALEIRFMSLQQLHEKSDLHGAALSFRLLRQHGYNVSQDVFKNFMDHKGHFKACHEEDVEGLLSLYEASHLGLEGENMLHEAMAFTRMHLEIIIKANKNMMSKWLEAKVRHALEVPLHHRIQRQEARWFIEEAYKNYDDGEAMNKKYPMLLELARLDFNTVQSTHQANLEEMSRWWKEIGLSSKLSFARDRLVESFFWAMGISFEPQHSNCLKGLTKVAALVTTIDDIYDVYGTLEELEIFTDVVKRWDVKEVEKLPYYMKLCFLALYNTINEMAFDNLKEHGVNVIPYLVKAWGDLCESFLQEAKWNHNKQVPKMDDYIENSWLSSSGALFLVHAYFLVSEDITKEAMECLEEYHDLLYHPSLLFRLYNDLSTSKAELERGETTNSIVCYMRETGVPEELGRKRIQELIDKSWREMNQNQSNVGSPFSKKFVETTFNLSRIAHLTYQHGDTYGAPDIAAKNRIKSLIMEPISFTSRAEQNWP